MNLLKKRLGYENQEATKMHIDACQCCLSRNYLINMFEKVPFGRKYEVYSDMLYSCFSIKIDSFSTSENKSYSICKECIIKLRDCLSFRKQVEIVQNKMKESLRDEKNAVDQDGTDFLKMEFEIGGEFDCDIDDVLIKIENTDNNINFDTKLSKKTETIPNKKSNLTNDIKKEDIKKLHPPIKRNLVSKESKSTKKTQDKKKLEKEKIERKRQHWRIWYAKAFPFTLDKSAVTCEICKETFMNHSKLMSHMNIHYPNFVCDKCGKPFVAEINLKNHINNIHESKIISCKICNKNLKKGSFLRHMRSHNGKNLTSRCLFCPEKFVSYNARIRHMKDIHNHIGVEHKCKLCSKTFLVAGELSRHFRRIHLLEKKHSCSECNECFFSKSGLRNHMVKHTNEKNFHCQICPKSYGRKKTLVQHMKIHDNIKEHVCNICGRAFTQKCVLQSHMKTHEKNKLHTQNDHESQQQC